MKTTVIYKYILLFNSIYTMVCSHVASNSVLFAESADTTSAVRQQGSTVVVTHGLDRFHDERKMSYETRK